MFKFLFGMFSFVNEEIDEEILNYDVGNVELRIFGKMVYLNPDLVSQATKFHIEGDRFLVLRNPSN